MHGEKKQLFFTVAFTDLGGIPLALQARRLVLLDGHLTRKPILGGVKSRVRSKRKVAQEP